MQLMLMNHYIHYIHYIRQNEELIEETGLLQIVIMNNFN